MDYNLLVPVVMNGVGIYLALRTIRFMEAQPGVTPTPKLTFRLEVRRHWPIATMAVLMMACWIPYFATPRCPKEYFQGWGSLPDRLFAVIDTSDLINDKPNRLMIIARPANNAVNDKIDTQILRGATVEISPTPMRIDVFLTPQFVQQVAAAKVSAIAQYLLEVPADFPVEAVHSLADAEKRGGKILGVRSGGAGN